MMRTRQLVSTLLCCIALAGCEYPGSPDSERERARPGAPQGHPLHESRAARNDEGGGISVENGWLVRKGRVIWGYAQHNGWWGGYRGKDGWWHDYKVRANLTRRAPGEAGPGRTEDLDRLTDAMIEFGYPGFEHNFGLWYDRRRDVHDSVRRTDAKVVPPFLEQPWSRSQSGTAWDGLPRYDLEKFNDWYFSRLREFAALSDRKGTVLIFNFYMQHALLEYEPHYVDFPWRPVNTIQDTGMPDAIPAANAFYDISHPERRRLHRLYIQKCLDELGGYSNVIFLPGQEFTGPLDFVQFWLDTVQEWEIKNGRTVVIGLGATKDVLDAILEDPVRGPHVSVLDLRYWWYLPDGKLYAPPGGMEIPGRYAGGGKSAQTTPEQIYRQIRQYREVFPQRVILHTISADRRQTWAFLMGGGSLLLRPFGYQDSPGPEPWRPPLEYIAPYSTDIVLPAYEFINTHLAAALPETRPMPALVNSPGHNWCLADPGRNYLVYLLNGGDVDLDLQDVAGRFSARWLDPVTGQLQPLANGEVVGGKVAHFEAPAVRQTRDWVLWLSGVAGGPEPVGRPRTATAGTPPAP